MVRQLIFSAVFAAACLTVPTAMAEEDELVRLPGNGELRDPKPEQADRPERLKPGGGLFISFDSDADGAISAAEIATGIPLAFNSADGNGDGYLTALEQREWAGDLPTRDDSLANPVRFDPNLDRRVSLDEFSRVINGLARDYLEEGASDILLVDLKAPPSDTRSDRQERAREATRQRRAERSNPSRLRFRLTGDRFAATRSSNRLFED